MVPLSIGTAFVLLWSSGFVGAALAPGDVPSSAMLAWRYLITALILLGLSAALRRQDVRRLRAGEVSRQALLGLLAHVVYLGGVFGAVGAGVDAGTVALVAALQPMVVVVAGRMFWGDPVRAATVLGLAVGLGAVGVTVGDPPAGAGGALLLPLLALAGLVGAALLERRWQPATDVLLSLTVQVTTAAVAFGAAALVAGTWDEVVLSGPFALALAWLVVLSGLGGYSAFLLSLRRLGASTTSTLLYLTPPVTTLWAWTMLAETPSAGALLGLALGALAVVLVLGPDLRRPPGRARVARPRRRAGAERVAARPTA